MRALQSFLAQKSAYEGGFDKQANPLLPALARGAGALVGPAAATAGKSAIRGLSPKGWGALAGLLGGGGYGLSRLWGGGGDTPAPELSTMDKIKALPGQVGDAAHGALSGIGGSLGEGASSLGLGGASDWIKNNPALAGGLGVGAAGLGGYGLYSLLKGKKKTNKKEAALRGMYGVKSAAQMSHFRRTQAAALRKEAAQIRASLGLSY